MRRDMFKVIVERPRRFARWGTTRGRPPRDMAEAPRREGMRRPFDSRHVRKELNENLAPLRRYLLKQVGRPWNKVFGEICEHLRRDSTVQDHVRRHVADFVSTHVAGGPDGRMWDRSGRGRGWWLLYVDPRTGILRLNAPRGRSGR